LLIIIIQFSDYTALHYIIPKFSLYFNRYLRI